MKEPPHKEIDLTMSTEEVFGEGSAWTARGWACLVNKILARPGKTLRDKEGRLRFTRRVFLELDAETLQLVAAHGLQVDVTRIPWGAFAGEERTFDYEKDWEQLKEWTESQY